MRVCVCVLFFVVVALYFFVFCFFFPVVVKIQTPSVLFVVVLLLLVAVGDIPWFLEVARVPCPQGKKRRDCLPFDFFFTRGGYYTN